MLGGSTMARKVDKSEQFISLADASQNTPYSQEYLSLLARKGKIVSKKIGRNWYTTRLAVEEYISQQGVHVVIPSHAKNKVATLASYSIALPAYGGETANPEPAISPLPLLEKISENITELKQLQIPVPLTHKFYKFNRIADSYIRRPKRLMAIVITSIILLFLIGGGWSFGNVDKVGVAIKKVFKDATSIDGH